MGHSRTLNNTFALKFLHTALNFFSLPLFGHGLIITFRFEWIIAKRKINRLRDLCLRLIYKDKHSKFLELLEKDCSASIHSRNLKISCHRNNY